MTTMRSPEYLGISCEHTGYPRHKAMPKLKVALIIAVTLLSQACPQLTHLMAAFARMK